KRNAPNRYQPPRTPRRRACAASAKPASVCGKVHSATNGASAIASGRGAGSRPLRDASPERARPRIRRIVALSIATIPTRAPSSFGLRMPGALLPPPLLLPDLPLRLRFLRARRVRPRRVAESLVGALGAALLLRALLAPLRGAPARPLALAFGAPPIH